MKSKNTFNWTMSLVLIFVSALSFAQDQEKTSIGEVVYVEYQENGIDQAISKYQELKANEPNSYIWDEWELNNIGYKIMNEDQDMDAAKKIFKLNMEEYPEAANPYDSYADYLIENGKTEEAKEYLRKSVSIAEKSNKEDEKTRILSTSKGKLAKLENKDRQMDFLIGEWNIEATGYNQGKEAASMTGKDKIEYNENANALFIHHFNDQQESEGVRIITYDAMDDEFDVAYLSPNSLMGIQSSSMKMKKLGDNKYQFMDRYTDRSGNEQTLKHELEKVSENELNWLIYQQNDQGNWEKYYVMHLEK